MLGEDKALLKEARLLNRAISWRKEGLVWEPDPRHCEIVWRELGMDPKVTKSMVAPGVRESAKAKDKKGVGSKEEYEREECSMGHCFGELPKASGRQDFNVANFENSKSGVKEHKYLSCPDCDLLQNEDREICGVCECRLGDGSKGQAEATIHGNVGMSESRG